MPGSVLLRTLADRTHALVWWSLGVSVLALLRMAFYPSVRDSPALTRLFEEVSPAFRALIGAADLVSPEGYLNAGLFAFLLPVLFLTYTIGFGSDAIAGEEQRKTMDLLLSMPISRTRLVIEKFVAMVVLTTALAVALWIALVIGSPVFEFNIAIDLLAAQVANVALLSLVFGATALVLGSATGRRAMAAGVVAGIAVAAQLVNSLAPLVESLRPYQKLSPFYQYSANAPLVNGLSAGHVTVLATTTLALGVAAVIAFQRRDVHG